MTKRNLLLLFFLIFFFSWYNYHGITFSDEYEYARIAFQISDGTFQNTGHHFDNRFGLTLPIAGMIKLTGFSGDRIYTIWSLICYLGLIGIFTWLLKSEKKEEYAFWILVLLAINPALLFVSADVSPDLVMTFFVYCALIILWKIRQSKAVSFWKVFLFSLALFLAFATKLTMLFCLPFFGFIFFLDLKNKQYLNFWIGAILISGLLLITYFSLYDYYFDNAFLRFSGIETNHGDVANTVPWNYANRPLKDYLLRITAYPIGFFLNSLSYSILGILALLFPFNFSLKKISQIEHFLFLFLIISTFFFWFGSTSLKGYNPVILADRMLLPLIPALTFIGVKVLRDGMDNFKIGFQIRTYFGLIILICIGGLVYFKFEKLGFVATIIASLIYISFPSFPKFFMFSKRRFQFLLGLFLVILIYQIATITKSSPYFSEKKFFTTLHQEEQHIILTDPRTVGMVPIYFGFQVPNNLQVLAFEDLESFTENEYKNIYIHQNYKRLNAQIDYNNYKLPANALSIKSSKIITKNSFFEVRKLNESYFKNKD